MKKLIIAFSFCFSLLIAQPDFLHNGEKIGNGVEFLELNNNGTDIFIGYGGWSVKQENNNAWCENLYLAKLKDYNVKYLFSVKGPDTPCYLEKEINNLHLAKKLIEVINNNGNSTKRILIAAHSSGSFVAHQLFQILYGTQNLDSLNITADKIHYFNLDGGIGSTTCGFPIDSNVVKKIAKIYAVFAYDDTIKTYSPNYEDMIELGKMFGNKSDSYKIDVSGSGCKGKWCFHDTLIIRRPHNPASFDLINDYKTIDNLQSVQTDYFDLLLK